MSNPYQAPYNQQQHQQQPGGPSANAPAIALIVISAIAIGIGLLGLAGDIFIIASGMLDRLEAVNEGPVSEKMTITIRIIWGLILIAASSFVLYGAIKMKNLSSYSAAKAASVVAMIPLVGPCCLLGIPFGLWAFITLNNPEVKRQFRN